MEARVVFVLTTEEKDLLERLAQKDGRTKSNLIRKWIKEHSEELKDDQ